MVVSKSFLVCSIISNMETKFNSFLFSGLLLNVILTCSCVYGAGVPSEGSILKYSVITTPSTGVEDAASYNVGADGGLSQTAIASIKTLSSDLIQHITGNAEKTSFPDLGGGSSMVTAYATTLSSDRIRQMIQLVKSTPSISYLSGSIGELEAVLAIRNSTDLTLNTTLGSVDVENKAELISILDRAGYRLVIMEFIAQWCPFSRSIMPKFEELAEKRQDVLFLKVDVDKSKKLSREFGVKKVPTFYFIKYKQLVHTIIGGNSTNLQNSVQKYSQ